MRYALPLVLNKLAVLVSWIGLWQHAHSISITVIGLAP